MKCEIQNIYKAKTKYKPIYINIPLYEELFEKFDFNTASKKMSDMFSITTKNTGILIDTCQVDYQTCPLNISLNGNKGSGRAFFYKEFNIKGDKTVLATSTNEMYNNGFLNIEAGLKESFTKESGKHESKSLLNNCIITPFYIKSSFLSLF